MKKKLQIFVSSTYTDLLEERQAAVEAILKAGHIPAGMELFAAGDVSQMETIKKWIDTSDIYMLILGGRYGSMEPKNVVSYIELEYEYATKKKKPLFAVVIKEEALENKIRVMGSKVFEKENQEKYKKFRKKVLSKTSSFFNDSKDIKLSIHESINDLADKYDFKGWVSGEYAKTEEELEKINAMHEYINKLEKELSEVQKRLDRDTSHLAQGKDKFEINISIPGFEQKVLTTWDDVFFVIAKQCISGDFKSLENYIIESIAEFIGKLISLNNIDAIMRDKSFLINFEKIRIQFLALDLFDISTKTYGSGNVMGAFWNLTSRGKKYLSDLTAIKR